jgi:hypothetical protein
LVHSVFGRIEGNNVNDFEEGYQKAVPQDDPNAECCACDEADYEALFVGIWSKETHPKDYPTCKFGMDLSLDFTFELKWNT